VDVVAPARENLLQPRAECRGVPKGPDPRIETAPLADVPRLLREGAAQFNAREFWHAHEAWETAWHALRKEDANAAEFLHGVILVAAALENAKRGKESGFKRQYAEGLYLMRTHLDAAPRVGLDPKILDALALLYVDACRRLDWALWNASGWSAPTLEFASDG
jgi:predicted metal-dependent hydrolase